MRTRRTRSRPQARRGLLLTLALGALVFLPATAQAQDTGTIAGTATDADTGASVGDIRVEAWTMENPSTSAGFTTTAADGSYTLDVPAEPEGTLYEVVFTEASADRSPAYRSRGQRPGAGAELPRTGFGLRLYLTVALLFTGVGASLWIVERRLARAGRARHRHQRTAVVSCVVVTCLSVGPALIPQGSAARADSVTVRPGETTVLDVELQRFAGIEGVVTSAETDEPVANVCVWDMDSGSALASTDSSGTFLNDTLSPDEYTLLYSSCTTGETGFVYSGGTTDPEAASPVAVTAGQVATADASLSTQPGSITGEVSGPDGFVVCVYARQAGVRTAASSRVEGSTGGTYTIGGVPAGDYAVEFEDCGSQELQTEYFDDKPTLEQADAVNVGASATTPDIDAVMSTDAPGGGTTTPTPTPVAPTPTPLVPLPIDTVTPETIGTVDNTTPAPGESVTVEGDGFAPDTDLRIEFQSTPVFLGTTTSDAAGRYRATVTIPPDATPGRHHVVVSGLGADGTTLESRTAVDVTAAAQQSSGAQLPRTGTNAGASLLLGIFLLGVGVMLVGGERRLRYRHVDVGHWQWRLDD